MYFDTLLDVLGFEKHGGDGIRMSFTAASFAFLCFPYIQPRISSESVQDKHRKGLIQSDQAELRSAYDHPYLTQIEDILTKIL